ncbi:MAG: hypothetical protein MR902_02915 [Campylobacter sp.]|nr:hypothetical protein [Campylobacter sp.]
MRIFVDCECILLQKSLEIFLKDELSSKEKADFVISDEEGIYDKPLFLISAYSPYLNIPFNKFELFSALKSFSTNLPANLPTAISQIQSPESIEDKISDLFDEFKDRLIQIIKESR